MLNLTGVFVKNHYQPFTLFHCGTDGFLQPLLVFRRYCQLIDNHFYVMVLIAVYLHAPDNLKHFSVNSYVEVSLLSHRLEEFSIVTFSASHHWGKNKDLLPLIVMENHVQDLLLCIFHHLLASMVAVCLSGSGIEKTHIVVDFCRGTYSRTRILICGLLLDADYWRETGYFIHIRTFHPSEEVSCVGRECFDISSLPLCKDGIEGKG